MKYFSAVFYTALCAKGQGKLDIYKMMKYFGAVFYKLVQCFINWIFIK
jgi:hypothetical protein